MAKNSDKSSKNSKKSSKSCQKISKNEEIALAYEQELEQARAENNTQAIAALTRLIKYFRNK